MGRTARLPNGHATGHLGGVGTGLAPEFTVASPTQAYPIPMTITFKKVRFQSCRNWIFRIRPYCNGRLSFGFVWIRSRLHRKPHSKHKPCSYRCENDRGIRLLLSHRRTEPCSDQGKIFTDLRFSKSPILLLSSLWERPKNATSVQD